MLDIQRVVIPFCLSVAASAAWADPFANEDHTRARAVDLAIVGDTAALLEEGELVVTLGTSLEDEGDQKKFELVVEIEYGVTDGFEIGVAFPYLFLRPEGADERDLEGVADMTLSVSWRLLTTQPVSVSALLDVSVPTGNENKSRDLGDGLTQWSPSLIADVKLDQADLVLALGAEFLKNNTTFNFDLKLAYPVGETVPSIGFAGSLDGDEKELFLVPGVGFPITEDVDLGLQAAIGLNRFSSDWKISVEFTFDF